MIVEILGSVGVAALFAGIFSLIPVYLTYRKDERQKVSAQAEATREAGSVWTHTFINELQEETKRSREIMVAAELKLQFCFSERNLLIRELGDLRLEMSQVEIEKNKILYDMITLKKELDKIHKMCDRPEVREVLSKQIKVLADEIIKEIEKVSSGKIDIQVDNVDM